MAKNYFYQKTDDQTLPAAHPGTRGEPGELPPASPAADHSILGKNHPSFGRATFIHEEAEEGRYGGDWGVGL